MKKKDKHLQITTPFSLIVEGAGLPSLKRILLHTSFLSF